MKKSTDTAYVFDAAPTIVGDDYTFTINYSSFGGVSVGDTIQYYFAAQDIVGNAGTNPAGGAGVNPPGTTPTPNPDSYLIIDFPMHGTFTVGAGVFERLTGKKVYFENRTREVTRERLDSQGNPQLVTVTETYKEIMENGKPFDFNFFKTDEAMATYPTLSAAINDMTLRGVDGPVTFELMDTYYPNESYPIVIGEITGSSAANTITIKPSTGVVTAIPGDTLQTAPTLSITGNYITIDGSNTGGTTKDLTITGLPRTYGVHALDLSGTASYNTFKNVIFESKETNSSAGTVAMSLGTAMNYNVFDNCTFQAIDTISALNNRPSHGFAITFQAVTTGTEIRNCVVKNFFSDGLYLFGAAGMHTNTLVTGCDIYMDSASASTSIYGIYSGSRSAGLVIENTRIRNLESNGNAQVYGMNINGGTGVDVTVKNNFVKLGTNQVSGNVYGIDYNGNGSTTAQIYNNSVYIDGIDTVGNSYGFSKRGTALSYKAYNNTIYNARSNDTTYATATGKNYAVYMSNITGITFEVDNNNYYVDGIAGVFGRASTADILDLDTWKAVLLKDTLSVSGNPGYVDAANGDLHILSTANLLDGKGVYIASVPTDIDGDVRNATTPDIGADEYSVIPLDNPTNVTATAIDSSQIDLTWTKNTANDDIMVVSNLVNTFGFPINGTPYAVNDTIPGGGVVIYSGAASNFSHTGLIKETRYYYLVYSLRLNENYYSSGVWASDSTLSPTATTFQLSVSVANGWNMVSIPGLNTPNQNVDTWWTFRDQSANVFKYTGGYQSVTDAVPGTGYWMKHSGANTYNTGDEWPAGGIQIVAHDPLTGASGWNLIGGYEISATAANVTTVPPGLQSGPIYKYSGGYQTATTIDPGYGYWIKLTGAGQIIIPETLAKGEAVEYFPENWGKIVMTDAAGISYTLYAVKGEVDLDNYELPPAPMAGMFDMRYSSGRIAEDINESVKTIDMSGVTYPLTVKAEGMDIRLMDETGKTLNVNLKKGEDVVISDATISKLMVSGELIPAVYALEQNYPNPFNPSTVIEFSLPEDVSNVKLSIYNALGERVAELVNTNLLAGKYSYTWNAKNVATGMYIYELRTDNFVSVKKMLLLK
jgi:hypothetical protein